MVSKKKNPEIYKELKSELNVKENKYKYEKQMIPEGAKVSDEEKKLEIEELEGLFEDEGDPQYQFAKLFYETDNNINFKTDLDKIQLRGMPKVEIAENIIIDEFGLDKEDLNIEKLILTVKQEAVSKKRLGRVEAPKFIGKGEETKKKGFLQRLLTGNN